MLYVDDLPDLVDSECRLIADDTLLFHSLTNKAVLQKDLITLQKYANDSQPNLMRQNLLSFQPESKS